MADGSEFIVSPTGGKNGNPLIVEANDALYEAFKAALLGQGSRQIPALPVGQRFAKQERSRLSDRNPYPQYGPWVENIHQFDKLKNPNDPVYGEGYAIKVKFIPPVAKDVLKLLIARFKDEFALNDSEVHSFGGSGKKYPAMCLSYIPGGDEFDTVNLCMQKDEFAKIQSLIPAVQLVR